MESPEFWRDLEIEFRKLDEVKGAFDFHATHDDTDPEHQLREAREVLAELRDGRDRHRSQRLARGPAGIDRAARARLATEVKSLRRFVRACQTALQNQQRPRSRWIIAPSEGQAASTLEVRFESLVIRGAIGADLVGRDATAEASVQAWLDRLRDSASPYWNGPWIDRLCEASAVLCGRFASDAYREKHAPQGQPEPGQPAANDQNERARRREAFLGPHLARRHLSLVGLAAKAGVTPDAVLDYANGVTAKPRIATRQKIAKELGVNLGDVPG